MLYVCIVINQIGWNNNKPTFFINHLNFYFMPVTTNYNRSEIYSFFDLSDTQKESVLNSMDESDAENDSFVIFKGKKFEDILPLSMFMRINYGSNVNNKPTFWDGVYGTSYFSAYFIKLSKCGSACVVAEKFI